MIDLILIGTVVLGYLSVFGSCLAGFFADRRPRVESGSELRTERKVALTT